MCQPIQKKITHSNSKIMKKTVQKITLTVALAIAISVGSFAQSTTYLREVALTDFNKIQVSLDADVIVLKSQRNHVTLVGDSSYIASVPVLVEGGILEFSYNAEPNNLLQKVVIEYKDLDHATTGGIGTYYFHNIKQEKLVVFNPYANVVLSGNTDLIRVVSQEGTTDITALTSQKEAMFIGDSALLVSNDAN